MSKSSKPSSATPKESSASSFSSPISGSPRAVSAPTLKKGPSDISGAPSRLPILPTGAGSGQEDLTSPDSTSRDALASPSSVLSNPTSPNAASTNPHTSRLADIDELGNTFGFFAQDAIDYSIPDDPSNLLLHEDGAIRAGSLPKIIQRLTSLDSQVSMLFDFLMTYRSYATPRYLLALLRRRFEQVVEGEDIKVIRLKTMLFVRQWIEKTASDFVDDNSLIEAMTHFIASWEHIDPSTQRTASVCQAALTKAVDTKDADGRTTTEKVFAVPPPQSELPSESDPTRLTFMSISSLEMARQWTLIEWKFWEVIKPTEFLNLAWTRKNKEELAPNIVTLTKNFNRAAGWVATMIQRAPIQKERVKVLSKMIDIADELRILGNFSGLMEVLSGLGSASVYRLKSTWEMLPPKQTETYNNLKNLMSPDLSFKRYREHLKNVNPPTIPYLGISLTDLTFIYEGSRDYSNDKLVNFTKSRMVSEILKTISQYQDASYNLAVVPVIRDYMLSPTIWDDNTLYSYSLWNEPRPGTESSFEPPTIVYLEGGPSTRSSMILNASTADSIINLKPKIVKEPPKEWKSSSLVIRRGILRAADLYHACLHLLYINESDPQYIQFGNVFFNAIKQFGGLDKVLSVFETILADAPTSDDLIPPTASQTFLAFAPSTSPRSGSKKSETLTISITPTLPVSEGLQKSASASSVSSPRSYSSNNSADSDSDTQNILKPRRKMSSELLSLDLSSSPAATPPTRKKSRRSLRDDTSSGVDSSSEEKSESIDARPPSPRSQSATLRPGKTLRHRRASTNLADLMEEAGSKIPKDTLRDSSEFATMTDPYWPPKTHAELARTMLDICINWGARYTSMSGPSRESKPLQLLPAWMESKLSQVDGMRETVQTAVTSFVKALASGPPDPARHNANIPPPKSYPVPSVPPAQQTIRMYHPEEIARQLAIWHQSEFANFTRDELFALSSYASSTLSVPSTSTTRSTYSILKALSEQLYDWVRNELTPLSEKTKKKTLAPVVELFTDVLHYSIELNSFLAARSVYRALDKCVIGDKSIYESDAVTKKTKETLGRFVALFTNGFGFVWNQRIASTQMSTSEPSMVLPLEWLESAIAHNQTEKDWWKGRSIHSFDKLGMVKQTWKGIERVTTKTYNLIPIPMLKEFLLTSMAGDSILSSLIVNAGLIALPIPKKLKDGKSVVHSDDSGGSSNDGSSLASASSNYTPSSPHSDASSSDFRDTSTAGSAPGSSSALNGRHDAPHIRTTSSSYTLREKDTKRQSMSSASSNGMSSTAASKGSSSKNSDVSPRGSRGGSTSSNEGPLIYGNTPDFRTAVLKMLGEDDDFRHSVISALVTMGSITPPSSAASTMRESRISPKRRKPTTSDGSRIATMEAGTDRIRSMTTTGPAPHLTDSDSSGE